MPELIRADETGRVVFEGGSKLSAPLFVRSVKTLAGAPTFSNSSVSVNSDLTFEISGLSERQTFRTGMLPQGWFLKSVTLEVDVIGASTSTWRAACSERLVLPPALFAIGASTVISPA